MSEKTERIRAFVKEHKFLIAAMLLFIILKSLQILRYPFLMWDETVYIAMGKYLFSSGQLGYIEIIRPLIVPLYIGTLWKLGISNPFIFKWAMIPFTLLAAIFTYRIGKKLFNHHIGTLAALVYLGSGVTFIYSTSVLTGIPATLFMLISIDLFLQKKYLAAGILAGISVLTRFPFGLYVFALALFIAYKLITAKKEAQRAQAFRIGMTVALGIILITIPFFLYNYISYKDEVSTPTDAIFRPFLYGKSDIDLKSGVSFDAVPYYLAESARMQPLMLLGVIGFIAGLRHLFKKYQLLLYLIIIFFCLFFAYYSIRDIRFSIPVLPILALFTATTIDKISIYAVKRFNAKDNKQNQKRQMITYLAVFATFALLLAWVIPQVTDPTPRALFSYIQNHSIDGPFLAADPQLGAYINSEIAVSYYKYSPWTFTNYLNSGKYPFIVFSKSMFTCDTNAGDCTDFLNATLNTFENKYKLIYQLDYLDASYYLLEAINHSDREALHITAVTDELRKINAIE